MWGGQRLMEQRGGGALWKGLTVLLIVGASVAGFLAPVPALPIVNESIRNLFFHVPMWFAMIMVLLVSVWYSIRYLREPSARLDVLAHESAKTGIVLGLLGLATGSLWARFTWGAWWTPDPRLNGAAVAMLIYGAYLVLRGSFRTSSSGRGCRPSTTFLRLRRPFRCCLCCPASAGLRCTRARPATPASTNTTSTTPCGMVFYPAVIGWILFAFWLAQVSSRYVFLKLKHDEQ